MVKFLFQIWHTSSNISYLHCGKMPLVKEKWNQKYIRTNNYFENFACTKKFGQTLKHWIKCIKRRKHNKINMKNRFTILILCVVPFTVKNGLTSSATRRYQMTTFFWCNFAHSACKVIHKLFIFFRLLFIVRSPNTLHIFSMEFMSGLWAGQFITSNPYYCKKDLTNFAVWQGALSCMKMGRAWRTFKSRHNIHLQQFLIHCSVYLFLQSDKSSRTACREHAKHHNAASAKLHTWFYTIFGQSFSSWSTNEAIAIWTKQIKLWLVAKIHLSLVVISS